MTYVPKAASGARGSAKIGGKGEDAASRVKSEAGAADKLSHLFSLQRPIDANAREASFLSYEPQLPLEAAQLAAAACGRRACAPPRREAQEDDGRRAADHATTRRPVGGARCADHRGLRRARGRGHPRARGVPVSSPAATAARPTAELVAVGAARLDAAQSLFVTSSARLLPHALPTRLCSHNLLDSMRAFAQSELDGHDPQRRAAADRFAQGGGNAIIDRTDGGDLGGGCCSCTC